jgi:serine/threonine protein phosphatase PrpC
VVLDPARAGMAATLTALLTDGERVALAQVGDSRAYRLRAGVLTRLSRDQTLVQLLVDEGVITPEQARGHPRRHVVAQALDPARAPDRTCSWSTSARATGCWSAPTASPTRSRTTPSPPL